MKVFFSFQCFASDQYCVCVWQPLAPAGHQPVPGFLREHKNALGRILIRNSSKFGQKFGPFCQSSSDGECFHYGAAVGPFIPSQGSQAIHRAQNLVKARNDKASVWIFLTQILRLNQARYFEDEISSQCVDEPEILYLCTCVLVVGEIVFLLLHLHLYLYLCLYLWLESVGVRVGEWAGWWR